MLLNIDINLKFELIAAYIYCVYKTIMILTQ